MQVSVDNVTRSLPRPFFVIATQNPVEYEGVYPLPESQMDRFLLHTSIGYPDCLLKKRFLIECRWNIPFITLERLHLRKKFLQLRKLFGIYMWQKALEIIFYPFLMLLGTILTFNLGQSTCQPGFDSCRASESNHSRPTLRYSR
jgi:MoxR-like ATPase